MHGTLLKRSQAFIDEHPLLIYLGALPFTPTNSPLYQIFHDTQTCPTVTGASTLVGRSPTCLISHGFSHNVAFSPDGTRSFPQQLTPPCMYGMPFQAFEVVSTASRHDNFVLSAAFSPDGTRIVSGSADKLCVYGMPVWNWSGGDPSRAR